MMDELPYAEIIPDARNESDAASRYDTFYSPEDQRKYGVLAIKVEVVI